MNAFYGIKIKNFVAKIFTFKVRALLTLYSKMRGQKVPKSNFKGVGGGKMSYPSISFIFTYVIDLPFLVSKSAHLSPNSRRFRFYGHLKVGRRSEKYSDLTKT